LIPKQPERSPATTPRRLTILASGRNRSENHLPEVELVPKRPEEALFESISKGNKVPILFMSISAVVTGLGDFRPMGDC
jgi:hypothetical protein